MLQSARICAIGGVKSQFGQCPNIHGFFLAGASLSFDCQAGIKPTNVVLLHFDADVEHFTRCCVSCRDGCKCANIHLYLVTLCYQLMLIDPSCMGTSCAKMVSTLTAIWCVHCGKVAAHTSADISLVRRYVIHSWSMHYGTSCAKMVVNMSIS